MSFQVQNGSSSSDNNGRENFRRRLLNIDSNLGDQEVEQLKFLCRDFIPHKKLERSSSALDIFDLLMTEELLSEEDPFLLAELLYIMRQNSLLKHLNCTKAKIEKLLLTQKKVPLFRNLLYELSESIRSEDLKDMIFLVQGSLPKFEMTSLSFLEHLEKQAQIDADNLTLLENLCTSVAPNLMRKIEKYKREKEAEQSKLRASEVAVSVPAPTCCVPGAEEATGLQEESLLSGSDIKQLLTLTEETVYRMDRKHRGYCVIINNRSFDLLSERQGTDTDAECLKHVFEWLGFIVDMHANVTKSDLEMVLQQYKSHTDHADGDCFVFCVLTHGDFGAVYSSDDVLIPIRDIMSYFTAQECPSLANKPKLFFIQACQGKDKMQSSVSIEADAVNPEPTHPPLQDSVPVEADFLLGLATVPGYVSFRHKKTGSWYIQALCKYLKDWVPRQEDILSILTAVNDYVSRQGVTEKQMPQPVFTLRKKVIFPVPQEELLLDCFHCP